jgi:N-acetylmuramoyl-L-alanine amidase
MKRKIALFLSVIAFVLSAYTLAFRVLSGTSAHAFNDGLRIVVDAGHGGMDGGVVGRVTKVKESDVNLAVAFKLKELFTDAGFEVVLTRQTSFGLCDGQGKWTKNADMRKRKEIITQTNPSLVISVHQNFYPAKSSRGAQVFYSTTHEGSKLLALAMQGQLNTLYETQGAKPRVEKEGDFFILECIARPSVIVECGFLSNPSDEELLCSEGWQQKLAESIAAGVVEYLAGNAA